MGLSVRQVPTGPDGAIDLDALTHVFVTGTRVLIMVNPHNPSGRVLPLAELERLAELCAQHGVWVIADEIHAPLVLSGATHVPWLEVSDAARERGFALTAASKAFNVAGLKAAQLVTASPRSLAAAQPLTALREHVGLFGLLAAEVAFAEGDPWLDAVLDRLIRNRDLPGSLIADLLPGIRWTPPQAGYLAWLDCRGLGLGDDPAKVFLERGQVALAPGLNYGAGSGHVRLNFGTSSQMVTEMVQRMAYAVRDASRA
jgi:cystathionine beta-lyase